MFNVFCLSYSFIFFHMFHNFILAFHLASLFQLTDRHPLSNCPQLLIPTHPPVLVLMIIYMWLKIFCFHCHCLRTLWSLPPASTSTSWFSSTPPQVMVLVLQWIMVVILLVMVIMMVMVLTSTSWFSSTPPQALQSSGRLGWLFSSLLRLWKGMKRGRDRSRQAQSESHITLSHWIEINHKDISSRFEYFCFSSPSLMWHWHKIACSTRALHPVDLFPYI